ncbi:GNAT family N-acetyltransferase [Aestuariibacter halophilus]|uniref:GNAT family N-acetyltransferase n=1 Tax=Fluctibacter halophilus TaxID=226011 RepID=A0ABS8G7E8_9ALTE|nr:GNAT family N-acetyltransferase [Aestuariibacter halophilus]MCC2616046.1 GNAT family N-acetyltransferase [Aestuariibacter halophilus]
MQPSEIIIQTGYELMDVDKIHAFLHHHSTWAKGIPFQTVERALQHSLCFGAFCSSTHVQTGFCRLITDYATFANLVDVIVWPQFRGQGIASQLMDAVACHPDLQGLRRITLATSDAHGLYAKHGFTPLSKPDTFMERYVPDIYQQHAL